MDGMTLNNIEAENQYNLLVDCKFSIHCISNNIKNTNDLALRISLTSKYREINNKINKGIELGKLKQSKNKYYIDVLFGIELYKTLEEHGFKFHDGANNDVWRYLSLIIIPDIVYQRKGDTPQSFYSINNRIWLKTIWWYCMLSLQKTKNQNNISENDFELTEKMLLEFNTDYILNIVDRAGTEGFRIDLVRELVKQFYNHKEEIEKYVKANPNIDERDIPRQIMTLNTARLKVFEPNACEGGISGYVDELFNFILKGV